MAACSWLDSTSHPLSSPHLAPALHSILPSFTHSPHPSFVGGSPCLWFPQPIIQTKPMMTTTWCADVVTMTWRISSSSVKSANGVSYAWDESTMGYREPSTRKFVKCKWCSNFVDGTYEQAMRWSNCVKRYIHGSVITLVGYVTCRCGSSLLVVGKWSKLSQLCGWVGAY